MEIIAFKYDVILTLIYTFIIGGLGFFLGTVNAGRTIKKLAYRIVDRMEEKIIEGNEIETQMSSDIEI